MIFYLFFVCVSGLICKNYQCQTLSNNVCISYNNSTYLVNPCKKGFYCPIITKPGSSNCIESSTSPTYSWPGESCRSSLCAYGYSNGSTCIGQSANDPCKVSDDCNPGLYCLNNICQYLIPYNFGVCRSDYDCANSASCEEGICIQYFSKQEAEKTLCINNVSDTCQSGACFNDFCLGDLTNDNGQGSLCDTVNDCISSKYSMTIFPVLFYSKCECGMNGKSYCALFQGDGYMKYYRYYLNLWINSGLIQNCNTVRRFAPGCIKDM